MLYSYLKTDMGAGGMSGANRGATAAEDFYEALAVGPLARTATAMAAALGIARPTARSLARGRSTDGGRRSFEAESSLGARSAPAGASTSAAGQPSAAEPSAAQSAAAARL